MTTEEKQLLVKDLCARLPHKVKVAHIELSDSDNMPKVWDLIGLPTAHLADIIVYRKYRLAATPIENIRPYLRPMSSMTEEEENELDKIDKESSRIFFDDLHSRVEKFGREKLRGFLPDYETLDYLIAHHFDYRGLIPKGLALVALEGMYKTE